MITNSVSSRTVSRVVASAGCAFGGFRIRPFVASCSAVACSAIAALAPVSAQQPVLVVPPFSQAHQSLPPRIDARAIPPKSFTRPLTEGERKYAAEHGIVKANDPTVHRVQFVHVMHAVAPKPPGSTRGQVSNASNGAPATTGNGPLTYGGGQVLLTPKVIPVFWGFDAKNGVPSATRDPDGVVPYLISFLDSLQASAWLGTVNQYFQNNQQFISDWSLTVANPIFDDSSSPGQPFTTDSPARAYTNSDVHNEVERLIGSGQIAENSDDIIVVVTPHLAQNTDLQAAGACAAHFNDQGMSGFNTIHNYTFVSLPYVPDLGSGCGAGAVAGNLDGVSMLGGHEIAEAITDPYSNYWANIGAETAWTAGINEIGDLCAGVTQQTQFLGGKFFATQALWSNQDQGCVQQFYGSPLFVARIQTSNGHLLTAVNGGGLTGAVTPLATGATQVLEWETFVLTWENFQAKTFTISTMNGPFVTANQGGGIWEPNTNQSPIHTDVKPPGGAWEQFAFFSVPCANLAQWQIVEKNLFGSTCVAVQTSDGQHFISAWFGGGITEPITFPVRTDAPNALAWEIFQLQ